LSRDRVPVSGVTAARPSRWEVAAFPEFGDAQPHRAGARLPGTVAVAVAVVNPLGAALAIGGTGQPSTSSSIRRWAVKPIISRSRSASELFSRFQNHLVGHCWTLGTVAWFSDQTLPMIRDGTATRSLVPALWGALARSLLRRGIPPTRDVTCAARYPRKPDT
jgi:hypothetical protein